MSAAEVCAAAVDNFSQDDAFAVFLSAFFSGAHVSLMVELEFTGQALDIAIVGHRVSAEVYAF